MDSWLRVLFMALTSLSLSTQLHAADIEKLLMPGEVISGHAKFEADCGQCHVRFRKSTQRRLCLDCHDEIDKDITDRHGFHGGNATTRDAGCKSCHSEHLGRNADIVLLNTATFDHDLTDFALQGSHTGVSCKSCHKPDKAYAEADSTCHACHGGDQDPHQGKLGKACHDCHTSKSWQKFDFDHDKTDFALHGKHVKVPCSSCHINERYKKTPDTCHSCHALNDVHNGANGKKCASCHNSRKWDESDFDHNKKTDFPLRGKHDKVACEACHKDPVKDKKPASDCHSCHRNDDAHRGRYGRKCQGCHTEKGWKKARFDHRKTDFPLHGKHAKLACDSCHRGNLYKEKLAADCYSCHRTDDVHQGQQGKSCQRCHKDSGWVDNIVFDHDLTRFPLIGLHATAPCEECHTSAAFKDTSRECYSCHRSDDEHKSTLGPDCQQCHNPNSWAVWIFDHDKQTDFTLDGAHQDLHCNDCHIRSGSKGIRQSSSCSACHRQDDAHQGRFGSNCIRCHNTENFSDVQLTQ